MDIFCLFKSFEICLNPMFKKLLLQKKKTLILIKNRKYRKVLANLENSVEAFDWQQ